MAEIRRRFRATSVNLYQTIRRHIPEHGAPSYVSQLIDLQDFPKDTACYMTRRSTVTS
jgi:hypothetical protein